MFTHVRGKIIVSCAHCSWHSEKVPDESAARDALAYHNYQKHPGVFPRWNPDIHVVEKEVKHGRKKGAAEAPPGEEENAPSTDARKGASAAEVGDQPP